MSTRGKDLRGGDVVTLADVVEQLSSPFTLEAGHPLRRSRCLLCASMVGGRVIRSAVVVDYRHRGCPCGGVPSAAYLICSEHADAPDLNVCDPALARYYQHHQWGRR